MLKRLIPEHDLPVGANHYPKDSMADLRHVLALPLIAAIGACGLSNPQAEPTARSLVPSGIYDSPSPRASEQPSPGPDPTLAVRPTASEVIGATPSATATPEPTAVVPATAVPEPPSCALRTLASMTEAQRIGQMFMIGLADDRLGAAEQQAIAAFHVGSVLYPERTAAGVAAIRSVSDAVQAQATQAATHGVRLFVAANQEGGLVQALSGPGFGAIPSALSQGSMSAAELRTMAAGWGRELRAAGVNLDLAPVADVVPPRTDAQNAPIGQLDREFGHDPATVGSRAAAFIAGMQASGVDTTAKHFPGLGRVTGNTDFTSSVIDSVTTRHDPYLAPFVQAIGAGVPFVMISEATYERIDAKHLAVFSDTVINGLLRGDLAFRGVVISDSLGSTAVSAISPATRAIDFLDAGGDMIVLNQLDQAIDMVKAVASLAAEQAWFRARVDNAAWHVLRAKEAAGLLDCGG